MTGRVAIVPALNNEKNQYSNPWGFGTIGEPNNALHYVQIKHFQNLQLLVVAYHIFCEINVAHKELRVYCKPNGFTGHG